jgi:lipase
VCLHGVGGYGGRFRRLAQKRLASRFRVVALDLRGHGQSEWEPPWDLDTHIADLVETTSTLGIERAHWIGHSFGGRLVMELAARAPERIERAVLLDPAVWVPPPIALERAEGERAELSFASVDEAIEQRIAASVLRHSPREFLEEEMAEHLIAVDGRLRYRYCKSAVVTAYAEMAKPPAPFEALRVPTLLVRGAETDVVPEIYVDLYSEGIGDLLEVVTVPGGHTVLWDAFEETEGAVEAFLRAGGVS